MSALNSYLDDLGYFDQSGASKSKYGDAYFEQAATMYNMELANRYNLENWNRQNAYNSPEEQMKRYAAAGLNPNLVYGSAGQSAAGSVGSMSAPRGADFAGSRMGHLQRLATVVNTVQQVAGAIADTFQSIQGIKAAKLGNNFAAMKNDLASRTYGNYVNDPSVQNSYAAGGVFFPSAYKSDEFYHMFDERMRGLKLTNDQKQYYNEQIAPFLRRYYELRNTSMDQQNSLRAYNIEFMNSLSPGERTIWNLLNQALNTISRF